MIKLFLIIGTGQQLSKVQTGSISFGKSGISSSKEVRNLGTWLYNTLSKYTHVIKVAYSYYIYNIRLIRKYLSRGSVKLSLMLLSHIVLIIVTASCMVPPSSLLARLHRVQNSASRLIYNDPPTSSSSPLLINPPVKHRILFKILLITHKAIHSLAPEYIIPLIQVDTSNSTLRSSNAILLENSTIKSSKTLGDREFTLAAPVEWNLLPQSI